MGSSEFWSSGNTLFNILPRGQQTGCKSLSAYGSDPACFAPLLDGRPWQVSSVAEVFGFRLQHLVEGFLDGVSRQLGQGEVGLLLIGLSPFAQVLQVLDA